jgi:hypothetical protein
MNTLIAGAGMALKIFTGAKPSPNADIEPASIMEMDMLLTGERRGGLILDSHCI